jgi:hypothetical protein
MSRRQSEVTKGERRVPQGNSVMLGDLFASLSVKVVYNTPAFDLDDVLASYACSVDGLVLSNDNDFFRYSPRRFDIFSAFFIENGKLELKRAIFRQPTSMKPAPEERATLNYDEETMRSFDPSFYRMCSTPNPRYSRGASCSLVKICGNAHGKVAPLRCALWSVLGVGSPVSVLWTDWDFSSEGRFMWYKGEELADPSLRALFQESPEQLYQRFFGNERKPSSVAIHDWKNHVFACRTIVTELWLRGQPEDVTARHSLFSLVCAPKEQSVCKFFLQHGRCKYGQDCRFKHK